MRTRNRRSLARSAFLCFAMAAFGFGGSAGAASLDGSGGAIRVLDSNHDGQVRLVLTDFSPGATMAYYSINDTGWHAFPGKEVVINAKDNDLLSLALDRDSRGGIDASAFFITNTNHAIVSYLGRQSWALDAVAVNWKTSQFALDLVSAPYGDTFQFLPLPGAVWLLASGLAGLGAWMRRRTVED